MITYENLREKFIDKGYQLELQYLILSPPMFLLGRCTGTREEQYAYYKSAVEKTYGEEWEYWDQWIDHQNYK